MLKTILCTLIFSTFILIKPKVNPQWGFFAHRILNEKAIYAIPEPLYSFYYWHRQYIFLHATDPDSRRSVLKDEACKHFIDIEYYEKSLPVDTFNIYWDSAIKLKNADSMIKHGILPWNYSKYMYLLTKAFSEKNEKMILKYSADIGHYISDACVPLHTTANYNGQLTGQHGLHAIWETHIPELFKDSLPVLIGKATYWYQPFDSIWKIIAISHQLKDSVLNSDKRLLNIYNNQRPVELSQRNGQWIKTTSSNYLFKYHELLNKMVFKQMLLSVSAIASSWYTAWVNAGMPSLKSKAHWIMHSNDSNKFEPFDECSGH